jgi:hypothetical protein
MSDGNAARFDHDLITRRIAMHEQEAADLRYALDVLQRARRDGRWTSEPQRDVGPGAWHARLRATLATGIRGVRRAVRPGRREDRPSGWGPPERWTAGGT